MTEYAATQESPVKRVGWIGTGRMGYAMVRHLLAAGYDVAVYNRTRSKAEPLAEHGATVVDAVAELADREVVFTMVATGDDFREVTVGPEGVLRQRTAPAVLIDSSTVDAEVSGEVRAAGEAIGTALLAAPVSGNPSVVASGQATMVVSGPEHAYERARPLLEEIGRGVAYVGGGETARLVKLCHNIFLGVITQSLAEITVLAEKGGVSREAFLTFLNDSVLGSAFTRYKTPAFVGLDLTPTFTPVLLRKDFDLGLAAARELETPMPVATLTAQLVGSTIGQGHRTEDFAVLLHQQAGFAGLELRPEPVEGTRRG